MIYFINFLNFDFVFKFFLHQHKKIYTLKLIIALKFSRSIQPFILLRSTKWVPGISANLVVKSKLPPQSGSSLEAVEPIHKKGPWSFFPFYQSPFQVNEMFCLPNKFALFNTPEQPLKCVPHNSYLDMRSNTLCIIWQGIHLLVKLQSSETNI